MAKSSRFRILNLEMGDIWLMENDKYYTNNRSNKMKSIEYPYLTPKQEVYRASKEIAFSNANAEALAGANVDFNLTNYADRNY